MSGPFYVLCVAMLARFIKWLNLTKMGPIRLYVSEALAAKSEKYDSHVALRLGPTFPSSCDQ